jgi:phosphoglycerate dehydrogenase-like enzyme
MEPMPAQVLEAASGLRVIARPGVGYDTVDLATATRRKVAVTVAAGTNDQSVADHAFGLLLMASRGLLTAVNSVQAHGWDRPTGTEAWRKTLAIVGYGRIGRAIARRARGFDMRVLVVTPRPDPADKEVEFVTLDEALAQADFVSLSAPLTPQTEVLINAKALAQMKKGAFLVNTSRGGLIDESALAEAVKSGHLGGAAVDVLRQQGANSPSPLIGVPGILVTPHMATLTRESMARVAMSVAAGVIAVLRGERAANTVNPEVYDGH